MGLQKYIFAIVACFFVSQSYAASSQKLVITGSSTIAPLMAEIAKAYESANPNVRIDVQSGGSGRGISDVRQGTADIGMVSRSLKPDEKDLIAFTVAMDGICIIVHQSNTVSELTKSQVVGIYTGKINNWKSVGGPDSPIVVVNKAEGRSTLELFLNYFQLQPNEVKASIIIGDNAQGIKTVAGNPLAIGYVSIGTAEYESGHGSKIRLLPLAGVAPSVTTVRNQSFPLSRPLNLVTKSVPQGLIKAFIEFAQSAAVQGKIQEQFFVPIAKTSG
jgi:phosphate transport system substrate-binding protein